MRSRKNYRPQASAYNFMNLDGVDIRQPLSVGISTGPDTTVVRDTDDWLFCSRTRSWLRGCVDMPPIVTGAGT